MSTAADVLLEFNPSAPDTVGAELELQLLNRESLDLVDGILPLMEFYPGSEYVKPEFIQNTVEIASKVCTSIHELHAHMTSIASDLKAKCRALDMTLCGAGSHPFCRNLALITPLPRYLRIERQAGYLGYTQITFATHVHLGMPAGDETVALMHELKPYLPLLIAISASSPFWRGYDTGYVSYRHRILAATRSYGVPPSFKSWKEFSRFFDVTRRAGLFATMDDIHWDIRPRPRLGTLEVRVMDAQPTVAKAMALAGFVRTLATFLRRAPGEPPAEGLPRPLSWWIEKENHFNASRHGLEANYIADEEGRVRPLSELWRDVADAIRPTAEELGEARYLDRLRHTVATDLGYTRQRGAYKKTGSLKDVVALLVEEMDQERTAPDLVDTTQTA